MTLPSSAYIRHTHGPKFRGSNCWEMQSLHFCNRVVFPQCFQCFPCVSIRVFLCFQLQFGNAQCRSLRVVGPGSVQEQRYDTYHCAQRMCTVYNFHAYILRFRCLPRPWRARAWRARRLKKGRHWRRRRTLISYLNSLYVGFRRVTTGVFLLRTKRQGL